MESANFQHNHQQQDLHLVDSSFSWSQNPNLNGSDNSLNSNINTSMVQDFGFPYNGMGYPIESLVTHELQRLARVNKDEFNSVAESYPKFLELLNSSPTSSVEDIPLYPYNSNNYMKSNDHHHPQIISYPNNNHNNNNQDLLVANISNGTFSQMMFPTTTISSLISQSTTSSSSSSPSAISSTSFDINCLPALDHFGSPSFSHHHSSLKAHNLPGLPYRFDRIHQPNRMPSVCSSKISSISTTTKSIEQSAKRPASNYIDVKATQTVVAPVKKTKSEPRSSSAPFQVRKEKLGDRIAAIQQLVAPFGKTDTASVLMEAIGYIKFLQTQVETLSVPYMKSNDEIAGISSKEAKRELRSRGLCLVPLSCLSYVTDGGEGIWSSSYST